MQFAPDSRFGAETRELVTQLPGAQGLSLLCPFRRCSVRVRAEYSAPEVATPAQSAAGSSTSGVIAGPWSAPVDLRNWLFSEPIRANE